MQEVGVLLCDRGVVVNVKDDMGLFCDQRVVRSKFVTEPPVPRKLRRNFANVTAWELISLH